MGVDVGLRCDEDRMELRLDAAAMLRDIADDRDEVR